MPIEVGADAPDFVLKDQNNQEVRLSDFRGQRTVLLVFYPLAFTGTCQGELCAVRDNLNDFVNDQVQVLTVSVDSSPTHKVWAEREGYQFPLLADFWPHGAVAQAYGVFNDERGFAKGTGGSEWNAAKHQRLGPMSVHQLVRRRERRSHNSRFSSVKCTTEEARYPQSGSLTTYWERPYVRYVP